MEAIKRVPLKPGAEEKTYYKYYLKEFATLSDERKEFLKNPVGDMKSGLDINDRNMLFEPGYMTGEVGIFPTKEGGKLVSNRTIFKDCKGEALQWWFAWHGLDPLRYSIWDPYDHYGLEVSFEDKRKMMDPNLSDLEKCQNVLHVVEESLVMGEPPATLFLFFKNPADVGYDADKIGTKDCSFLVCANVEIQSPMGRVPIFMTHMARDLAEGCELRSRFWMGYNIIDGKAEYLMPHGMEFPMPLAEQLLSHNFNEYTNLTEVLPRVYQEEK